MRYSVDEAKAYFAERGLIARVSTLGAALCIYDGDESAPGTWMEIDRIHIKNGTVSRNAVAMAVA